MSISWRCWPLAPALLTLGLCACGGGGGGGGGGTGSSTTPPVTTTTPYAPLSIDEVPSGTDFPLGMERPFPLDEGTQWHYAQVDATGRALPDVLRFMSTDATGQQTLREQSGNDDDQQVIRWTTAGLEISDPLGLKDVFPAMTPALPRWVELPTPMYALNSVRRLIRQGDLGGDVDADGKSDTYRAELSQTNLGFETQTVMGQSRRVLHLRDQLKVTIAGSNSNTPYLIEATEDSYIADGVGPVRLDRRASTSAIGKLAATSVSSVLTLKRFRNQGTEWTPAGLSFSLGINASGLVYDAKRQVFLASGSSTANSEGRTIISIDPLTARSSAATAMSDWPSLMAMAADGDSVYVLMVRSRDVRRLALPSLTEISRTPLPTAADGSPLDVAALVASPTAADTWAVATMPVRFGTPGTVHLARAAQWLPGKLTFTGERAPSVAFSTDGASVFAHADGQMIQADTTPTGLAARSQRVVDGAGQLSAYAQRLVAGRQVFTADAAMTLIGSIGDANDATPCTALRSTGRLVCQGRTSNGLVTVDGQSLAKLGSADYNFYSMSLGVQLVPGPAGTIAVAEYGRLVVFSDPLLQ